MRLQSPAVKALLAVIALFLLPAISNIEANALPASWTPFLWIAWPAGVLLAAPLVYLEIRQLRRDHESGSQHDAASAGEQLRLLAAASRNQWMAAANDRRLVHPAPLPIRWCGATAPVAGPVSGTGYPRFDPLPGLATVSNSELREGAQDELHQVYGGLSSGRLLLIGPPGAGKTTAAILLLLDALRYREQATPDDQAQIPVPVLFTLHGWDPGRGRSVTDWVAGKLAETYPMFHGRAGHRAATDLLAAGRISGFLDSLDEIPEPIRPRVLAALADAPFRLVLLTRTAEAVAAANHRPLAGAVALEMQPVPPTDAATHLLQPLVDPPPAHWKMISDHLTEVADHRRPASAVSEALNTPLALSLLRDIYGPTDPVDELLDASRFPTAVDVENHLLDHAITAAYTPRPGHPAPRYTVATAHRTLRYLATQLTEQHTSDLAWWHIPTWTTHWARLIRAVVGFELTHGLLFGLWLALVGGRLVGLVTGLASGLLVALAHGLRRGVPLKPQRINRFASQGALRRLVTLGLAAGLSGLLVGLLVGVVLGITSGLIFGLGIVLPVGLLGAAMGGLTRVIESGGSSLGPADAWREDRNVVLVAWLISVPIFALPVGLVSWLLPGLVSGLVSGLASGLVFVLPVGLVVGLVLGRMVRFLRAAESGLGSAALDTAAASVQLAIQHKIPLRLIAFLEDARSRHLLRTVGPVYQFRHAILQDRLALPTQQLVPHRKAR